MEEAAFAGPLGGLAAGCFAVNTRPVEGGAGFEPEA